MKKQLIFALAFSTFLLNACDEPVSPEYVSEPAKPISISAFLPTSALTGSEVAILGENFGASTAENFVTLNNGISDQSGWAAEIIQVTHSGMISVRIPHSLSPGEYTINVHSNGQSCSSKQKFLVLDTKAKN